MVSVVTCLLFLILLLIIIIIESALLSLHFLYSRVSLSSPGLCLLTSVQRQRREGKLQVQLLCFSFVSLSLVHAVVLPHSIINNFQAPHT